MTKIEVTISDDLASVLVNALNALNKYIKINISNDDENVLPAKKEAVEAVDTVPTLDDVVEYCNSKGYVGFNADRFHKYYSARNWLSKNDVDMIPNKGWQRTLDSWLGNGINCQSNAQSFTPIVPRVNAQEKYEVILEE